MKEVGSLQGLRVTGYGFGSFVKQINPSHIDQRGRAHRHNDAIEIIWDDGISIEGLLEGSQPIHGMKKK